MSKKLLSLLIIVPILTIMVLYFNGGSFFKNHYDDAYITYRYAANLASGKGLLFNAGEKVDAASSLLYTLILSGFYKIGLTDLEFVSVSLNLLSAGFLCLVVYKSILNLTKNKFLGIFLSLSLILHGFISGWAISGMETIFFTFLVSLFIYLYYFKTKQNYWILTIVMAAILITRMEGIILLGAWMLSEVVKVTINKERFDVKVLLQAVTSLSVVSGWYIFHYLYYGSFLSNALEFKRIATYYQPNPSALLLIWGGTSFFIVFLSLISIFLPKPKNLWSLYLFGFVSFFSLINGPYSDGARYSVHMLPILVILSSKTLNYFKTKPILRLKFLYPFFLLLIFSQTLFASLFIRSYMLDLKNGQLCRRQMGQLLEQKVKTSEYVLSGDIGMIAYQALNVNFIDLGSLTSKDVLELYKEGKGIDSIILSKKPVFLADSLVTDTDGRLVHNGLMNQNEYIKGIKTYSTLFSKDVLQNIIFRCSDNKRDYAIIDLKSLYKLNGS